MTAPGSWSLMTSDFSQEDHGATPLSEEEAVEAIIDILVMSRLSDCIGTDLSGIPEYV